MTNKYKIKLKLKHIRSIMPLRYVRGRGSRRTAKKVHSATLLHASVRCAVVDDNFYLLVNFCRLRPEKLMKYMPTNLYRRTIW